jgi:Predicted periplasmic lipoprotein (DUF2279)
MIFLKKTMKSSVVIALSFVILASIPVLSQTTPPTGETVPSANNTTTGASGDSETSKSVVRYSLLYGTLPMTFFFGLKTWDWGNSHEIRSEKEGWLGKDTSFGGADKVGHMYAHYLFQRGLYSAFNWTENGDSRKWIYSIGLTCAVGLFIELGDSKTSAYGFSYEDIVFDYSGILVGALLDRFPIADGFVGFSAHWYPTDAYKNNLKTGSKIKEGLGLVNDYSGWKYMFNLKFAGFENLGFKVPMGLRILQIDLGFYTRGYSAYDKGDYSRPYTRNIFVGISINSAQVLKESVEPDSRGSLYKTSHAFLEIYHLPLGYEKANDLND